MSDLHNPVKSHAIRELRIKNFRSIKETTLKLDLFSPLVGRNNAGKSNILNALDGLIAPSALNAGHFHNEEVDIEVEVEVSGVTDELLEREIFVKHATKIRPFLRDGCLRFRRTLPAGKRTVAESQLTLQDPDSREFKKPPTGFDNSIQALFPEPVRIFAMTDASKDAAEFQKGNTLGQLIKLLRGCHALWSRPSSWRSMRQTKAR